MRILVVGAGSTGGYFGARLAQAGRDVTFLVRPARVRQLQVDGLQILSPFGNFTIAPNTLVANDIRETFDVVLLTVKAYSLAAAIDDFAPAVAPDTMILPVLNGLRHVEMLSERFSPVCVVGCACKVATVVDDAGRIVQLNRMQELMYGELSGAVTERIKQLDGLLNQAVFTATLSPDIEREMWEKWVMLATLGGVTCLMRGNIGEVVAAPFGVAFAERFLAEVVATVSAAGHAPRESFLATLRGRLTESGSPWTSSIYRDLQQGRPVEADQILGDLLARARVAGVETPLLAAAFTALSVYQLGLAKLLP